MTGDLESVAGLADFRLIDPPRASQKPVAPNRLLLMPLALIVALGLGLASTFLVSQMRPVFYDKRSLNQVLGLPVLGAVNLVMRETEISYETKALHRFWLASSGLIVVFLIGMAVLSFVTDGVK